MCTSIEGSPQSLKNSASLSKNSVFGKLLR
jgi:hypothetical protein